MFCTKCGNKLNKNAKFCPNCGAKIVEEKEDVEKIETQKKQSNANNSTKTGSIVLGVISIITCCTFFIPIILGIVGIMLAVKARKEDPSFKAGLILNIIGIILVVIYIILAIVGIIMIGFNLESNLTHDWCCSDTLNSSNQCGIYLDLDDDHTYEIRDQKEIFKSKGSWDYDWLDNTKSKGEKYKLTLDGYDYTVYIKGHEMKVYNQYESSLPMMYCRRK